MNENSEYFLLKRALTRKYVKGGFKLVFSLALCGVIVLLYLTYFLYGSDILQDRNDIVSYLINDLYYMDIIFYLIHIFLLAQLIIFKKLRLKGSILVFIISFLMLLVWLYELYWGCFVYNEEDGLVKYIMNSKSICGIWVSLISIFTQTALCLKSADSIPDL
ncbi:MAG: hypothetical protein LUC92_02780 [Clostridiales bacterium]|nr:hypothetical protein [Clostridiales bacterium]